MPGEFLPPVVTVLTGDISALARKVAEAKALVKTIGAESVTVNVKFNMDQSSMLKAVTGAQALTRATNGLTAANNNLNRTMTTTNGRRMPGWAGWLTDPKNADAIHGAAVALMAVGAALAGAAVGAGALGAVWAKGASQAVRDTTALYQAVSGGRGNVANAFGLNTNPFFQTASNVGVGQVNSLLGGITQYLNQNQNPTLSNEGMSIGHWLDTLVAKMDLAKQHGAGFNDFLNTVNQDSINLGRSLANVSHLVGTAVSKAPGEIEWLTSGVSKVASGANALFSTSGGGDLLTGLLMLHSLTFLSGLAGKGLGALGFGAGDYALHGGLSTLGTNFAGVLGGLFTGKVGGATLGKLLPQGTKDLLAANKTMMGLGAADAGEASIAGGSILELLGGVGGASLLGAGLIGAGLLGYKIANSPSKDQLMVSSVLGKISSAPTTSQQLRALSSGMQTLGTTYSANLFQGMGGGPAAGSGDIRDYRILAAQARAGGYTGVDMIANNDALYQGMLKVGTGVKNETSGIVAASHAFGGLAQATALSSLAGVNWSKVQAGNAKQTQQQIQVIRNMVREYSNLNGAQAGAVARVNAQAIKTVSSPAWTNMTNVNSAMDTYVGAMTGGGSALGGIFNALQGVSPLLSSSKFISGSGADAFINTNQAISGSLEPLMDFYRQATSVGAISGPTLQKGILMAAAALGPLASNSKAAQDELVGMARQSGLNVKNFQDLMKQAGGANNALKQTTSITQQVADNFSKLGPLGQQVSSIMIQDQAKAFAGVAEQGGSLASTTQTLIEKMTQFPGHSNAVREAAIQQAAAMAQNGMSISQVKKVLGEEGLAWVKLPTGKKLQEIDTNAGTVAADLTTLKSAWDKIKSGVKTLTINEQISGSGVQVAAGGSAGHAVIGGHAAGVASAARGWAMVGERGPELMFFNGGETVIPNHRLRGYADGTGMGGVIHNHVYIDSKEVFGAVKHQTYSYNIRNGNRSTDGRVSGTMRPR